MKNLRKFSSSLLIASFALQVFAAPLAYADAVEIAETKQEIKDLESKVKEGSDEARACEKDKAALARYETSVWYDETPPSKECRCADEGGACPYGQVWDQHLTPVEKTRVSCSVLYDALTRKRSRTPVEQGCLDYLSDPGSQYQCGTLKWKVAKAAKEQDCKDRAKQLASYKADLETARARLRDQQMECPTCSGSIYEARKPGTWDYVLGGLQAVTPWILGGMQVKMYGQGVNAWSAYARDCLAVWKNIGIQPGPAACTGGAGGLGGGGWGGGGWGGGFPMGGPISGGFGGPISGGFGGPISGGFGGPISGGFPMGGPIGSAIGSVISGFPMGGPISGGFGGPISGFPMGGPIGNAVGSVISGFPMGGGNMGFPMGGPIGGGFGGPISGGFGGPISGGFGGPISGGFGGPIGGGFGGPIGGGFGGPIGGGIGGPIGGGIGGPIGGGIGGGISGWPVNPGGGWNSPMGNNFWQLSMQSAQLNYQRAMTAQTDYMIAQQQIAEASRNAQMTYWGLLQAQGGLGGGFGGGINIGGGLGGIGGFSF